LYFATHHSINLHSHLSVLAGCALTHSQLTHITPSGFHTGNISKHKAGLTPSYKSCLQQFSDMSLYFFKLDI